LAFQSGLLAARAGIRANPAERLGQLREPRGGVRAFEIGVQQARGLGGDHQAGEGVTALVQRNRLK
jgi:hypothetical protein